ncbi:hypothetical protein [Streptomyces sp. PT12]|uniref:hypothetical protein n=1 Tax=Streptomyces sp. PT12 TaxID=1510197 RepID=UPI000DE4AC83|nr:hypothetical protein [Streptomyces sp. PT12]RBM19725.1 hypothetical protein DEH69_09505 [Streptomyces sp. PT12]
MAIQDHPNPRRRTQGGTGDTAPAAGRATADAAVGLSTASVSGRMLAGLRVALGFVFLWAFLDKTFGLGYATQAGNAWTDGGSPTRGFLSGVAVGPLESTFHSWAGDAWADWLFMLGLLGIGLALTAGIALRPTALAGTLMMALMWAAEWPPAQHLSDGTPTMSSNPFMDSHLIYAIALITLAALHADRTWGLGHHWQRLPLIRTTPWLR